MRDLTIAEIGSLLFNVKNELEIISNTLSKWRIQGLGSNKMVPISVIAAETKINSTILEVEDAIQIVAKLSSKLSDKPSDCLIVK